MFPDVSKQTNQVSKCPNCPREFQSWKRLERHMTECLPYTDSLETSHEDEKGFDPGNSVSALETENVFKCNNCPREFSHLKGFEKHKTECIKMDETDTTKHYECQMCENSYSDLDTMISHIKAHPDEDADKYSCPECWDEFKRKSSFIAHLKQHLISATQNTEHEEAEIDESERKKYMKAPKIEFPFREENGRFYCLSGDCEAKGQSSQYINGLREHYLEKHATDDQKHFPCHFCKKKFGSNGLRNKHENLLHEHRFECPHCGKKVTSNTLLQNHLRTHTGEQPYECDKCDKRFSSRSTLSNHVKYAHEKNHTCDDCGKGFNFSKSLEKHKLKHKVKSDETRPSRSHQQRMKAPKFDAPMKVENGRYYCLTGECEERGQSFQWINGLKEHYLEKHAPEELLTFPCELCGKMFGTNGLRNKHEGIAHMQRVECPHCDKKFNSNTTLTNHLHTHTGDKPFVCEACGSDFFNERSLQSHIRKGQKKFKCEECNEQFCNKTQYNEHMLQHPGFKLSEESQTRRRHFKAPKIAMPMKEENGRIFCLTDECEAKGLSFQYINGLRDHFMEKHATDDQKHFSCAFCGRLFGTNALKNKHQNVYHQFNFECTLCDRKYGQKSMLDNHMRTHTGERPFVCESCGARFFMRGNLNKHIKETHVPRDMVRDQQCDQCERAFFSISTLKKHIRTVHSELRPFVCEECGKKYKAMDALKNHMETHSGIIIPCEPCNLTFSCRSHYKRHMRRKHSKRFNKYSLNAELLNLDHLKNEHLNNGDI